MDADASYPTGAPIALEPGDLVLIVTDGLEDTHAPDGSRFGPHRTLDVVRAHRPRTAGEIVDALPVAGIAVVQDLADVEPEESTWSCSFRHRSS